MADLQQASDPVIARVEAVPSKRNAWQHKYTLPKWVMPYMTVLAVYMTMQALVFPASLRVAFWPDGKHAQMMREAAMKHDVPIPEDGVLKYIGQLPFVWMHHVACLPWLFLMPLQMSTKLRAAWPAVHRTMGRFVVASVVISLAGLVYWDAIGMNIFSEQTHSRWAVRAYTVWFGYTIMRAIQAAKQHKYVEHRTWMLRHMGAGCWIILMRFAILGLIIASKAGAIVPWEARTEEERKSTFIMLNYAGSIPSVILAEIAVWQAKRQQAVKQA